MNGVVTEKYLWQNLTRLLAVYDGSDNLIMRFEYADGRMPVSKTKDGTTYYLTYDQVGSLRIIADAASNVVKKVDYDSFGNIISDTNPLFDIPFGFAGGLHDRDTGLVRFGYRDYDPDVGRWTAKDPILLRGGDADVYGYCMNNPINIIDPNGLLPFKPLPTSGCEYYKQLCDKEGDKCGHKDEYACKAYQCCKDFGSSWTANCVRGCLIEFDKRHCVSLKGKARDDCRKLAHVDCFGKCNALYLLLDVPESCEGIW